MIRVEAYAGASFPEHPTAVWIDGRRYAVQHVVRSWRTPDALHFLVQLETGIRQELVYLSRTDEWSLISALEEHS